MNWKKTFATAGCIAGLIALIVTIMSIGSWKTGIERDIETLRGYYAAGAFGELSKKQLDELAVYVLEKSCELVDSGYSKTIIFSKDSPADDNFIIFHANKGQNVDITITARSSKPDAKFRVVIDDRIWGPALRNFPFDMVGVSIAEGLRFDIPPGGCIHIVRFVPENISDSDLAVIKCLILVKKSKVES